MKEGRLKRYTERIKQYKRKQDILKQQISSCRGTLDEHIPTTEFQWNKTILKKIMGTRTLQKSRMDKQHRKWGTRTWRSTKAKVYIYSL